VSDESELQRAPYTFAVVVLSVKPSLTESKNGRFEAVSAHLAALFDRKGPVLEVFVYWLVYGVSRLTYLFASICWQMAAGEIVDFVGGRVGHLI